MFFSETVQGRAAKFNPGMRLEAVQILSRADLQFRRDTSYPKQTPKYQRLFQAICAEKKISRCRLFHPRNLPRCFFERNIRRARIVHYPGPKPSQQAFPAAKPGKTQSQPSDRQACSRFKRDASLESAQSPKTSPSLHRQPQPAVPQEVASRMSGHRSKFETTKRDSASLKDSPRLSLQSALRYAFSPTDSKDLARKVQRPPRIPSIKYLAALQCFAVASTGSKLAFLPDLCRNRRCFLDSILQILPPTDMTLVRSLPLRWNARREMRPLGR